MIFIQIPNSDSIAAKVLREKCNMFDPIEHVNLYNLSALKTLLLQILNFKYKICNWWIGSGKNYLNYDDPYSGNYNLSKNFYG